MKSSFYYSGHYLGVAERVKNYLNSMSDFLSNQATPSTRTAGDAFESLISERFDSFLQDWCDEYSSDFSRRAMADLAFTDKEGFYTIVDVKTHRKDTMFNMPNLTSVERLARFYESDTNVFSLIVIKYTVEDSKLTVTEVSFSPIEFLDWECLTIGALGWGQIQIANSNNIKIVDRYSRKKWMLQLCETMLSFYPKEILKTKNRITRFDNVKTYWESKEDIWD